MILELTNLQIILLNCLGIPVVHFAVSYLCEQLPISVFERDELAQPIARRSFYRSVFKLHRWKHLLPDAAPWMNGFPKGRLTSSDPDYLKRFIAETRRGELAHWIQWPLLTGFVAWNPYPASLVIILYAILLNLPCILNLRETRERLSGLLFKKGML